MLYYILMMALTFISTFMAADTLSHVFTLKNTERVATILFSIWLATLVLTVLDSDWMTLLGSLHTIIFVACEIVVYMRSNVLSALDRDYLRIPLPFFVPAFLILYMMREYL